jgi:hypothetical protein
MWTLRRATDEHAFLSDDFENPLLEWLTIVMAILAVIAVVALCACPFLATEKAEPGDMQRTGARHAVASPYPFLAVFNTAKAPPAGEARSNYALLRVSTAAASGSTTRLGNSIARGTRAQPTPFQVAAVPRN